ncbi:MAG TPA: hypothetical protein VF323_04010 [Candidatus Limnocylindrales bacterium]
MTDDLKPDADTAAEWGDAEANWEAQRPPETSIRQDVVDGVEAVGDAVLDTAESVVDMFRPKHVEADVPDLSDIPMTPEETTMRSTSVAHEEAPPDPGRS